jgi:beta-lactam-binding protein with PASTA domain
MALKEFLLSKTFRKHFLAAILLTLVLLWLTMQILSVYTHRGESLAIPDFSGMTVDQALKVAKKMNLRFELEDSVYRADKQPGTILTQNPGPGHKIKSGRLILLTLVSSVPGQEIVPKLTDISLRQARVLLESKGFALGKVEYIPSEFNDLVLKQRNNGVIVSPGSLLNNGATIDLVVGKNAGGGETPIPDFSGMTMAEAIITLDLKQLQAGSFVFDSSVKNHNDSVAARVISQSPQPDSTSYISTGSVIDFVLSLQPRQ